LHIDQLKWLRIRATYYCGIVSGKTVNKSEVFLGEIVAVYVNEDCLTDQKPDP